MRAARSAAPASLALCAASLAACGSSGGGPVPAAPARPLYTNVASATRGVLQLTLDAVNLDEFYAHFLRPGVGFILTRPGPPSPPVCHGSASPVTATSSTGTIETLAFYPAGDVACSKSPTRILVWTYGGSIGGAPVADGYELGYALMNVPPALTLEQVEQFSAVLYNTLDGSASLNLANAQLLASLLTGTAYPQSPPAPGAFPATFPNALPTPPAGTNGSPPYFAVNESAPGASKAGMWGNPGSFTNPFAKEVTEPQVAVGNSDVYAVRNSPPDSSGRVTLSWSDTLPYYYLEPQIDGSPPSPVFPLGPSNVSWPAPALGPLGQETTALNFPSPANGSATYGPDGSLIACSHTIVDGVNAVSAKATCVKGGSEIDLVVTDLHRSKPTTSPATIVIDPFGNGAGAGTSGLSGAKPTYTVLFDNSKDQIVEFTVAPCDTDKGPC